MGESNPSQGTPSEMEQVLGGLGSRFSASDRAPPEESQTGLSQNGQSNRPDADPILMALRSDGVPEITYTGPESETGKSPVTRPISNAGSDLSHITVLDRGDELYASAYPPGSQRPPAPTPTISSDEPLFKRLMTLRCCPNSGGAATGQFFFPRGSIEEIVTEDIVAETIHNDKHRLARSPSDDEISYYASRVCGTATTSGGHPETFCKIFAILVLMGRGWEVVLFVESGICDAHLPLEAVQDGDGLLNLRQREDPEKPLPCLENWTCMEHFNFENWQWKMLAPFFARGTGRVHSHFYPLSGKDILPWTHDEGPIHYGGYSSISRVKIHPCHHKFDTSKINDGTFAIKILKTDVDHVKSGPAVTNSYTNGTPGTFSNGHAQGHIKSLKEEFMDEIEILNRFSGDTNPHLVSLLAAYQKGNECALIFHWAHCNLKELWKDNVPEPPLEKGNLKWVLRQCRGIASGLSKIHCYETTESRANLHDKNRKLYGRHGDIKPDNILLYLNKENPNDRGTLVITDFGLTRFHSESQRTYFRKREIPTTLTYRPPECDMEDCVISRSFDIWSYGCVLLEFIAWYLGGWSLVQEFVQHRKAPDPIIPHFNSDQFFDISRPQGANSGITCATVKPKVIQFVNTKLHAHPMCCDIIHELLTFIMDKMLIVESYGVHQRANSQQVCLELDRLYQRLEDPLYELVGTPYSGGPTISEGVEIILNSESRNLLAAPERYSQLREHKGLFSRITSSSRHRRRPSGGGYYSPQRSETDPLQSSTTSS